MGETHEKSLLQNATFLPKIQSFARLFSNWAQRSLLAQFTDADEQAWKERVWIYATYLHNSTGFEFAETTVAQV